MSRTRTLADLRGDVRKRADVEGAEDRHPDEDLDRWINQGAAELRDLIIEVRGRSLFRSPTPLVITTLSGVTRYDLPPDFYRLISVRLAHSTPGIGPGYGLHAFTPQEEPALRYASSAWPTHYELQPGTIELLPSPMPGIGIVVEYITGHKDLVADDDQLEGYSGWEQYVVEYAAKQVFLGDDEREKVRECEREMSGVAARIQKLAPNRDAFRAERVKDVRGTRPFVGRRRGFM